MELTTRIGEENIFSAEPPAGYALTTGTTGPSKLVPFTLRHLDAYASAMRDERFACTISSLDVVSQFPTPEMITILDMKNWDTNLKNRMYVHRANRMMYPCQ